MPCGSFNNYARKVRDPGRPLFVRRSALYSCVQQYRDLSRDFSPRTYPELKARFGLGEPDDARLLAALTALETARNRVLESLRAFDARRLRQKLRGVRVPRKAEREALRRAVGRVEAEAGFAAGKPAAKLPAPAKPAPKGK